MYITRWNTYDCPFLLDWKHHFYIPLGKFTAVYLFWALIHFHLPAHSLFLGWFCCCMRFFCCCMRFDCLFFVRLVMVWFSKCTFTCISPTLTHSLSFLHPPEHLHTYRISLTLISHTLLNSIFNSLQLDLVCGFFFFSPHLSFLFSPHFFTPVPLLPLFFFMYSILPDTPSSPSPHSSPVFPSHVFLFFLSSLPLSSSFLFLSLRPSNIWYSAHIQCKHKI